MVFDTELYEFLNDLNTTSHEDMFEVKFIKLFLFDLAKLYIKYNVN